MRRRRKVRAALVLASFASEDWRGPPVTELREGALLLQTTEYVVLLISFRCLPPHSAPPLAGPNRQAETRGPTTTDGQFQARARASASSLVAHRQARPGHVFQPRQLRVCLPPAIAVFREALNSPIPSRPSRPLPIQPTLASPRTTASPRTPAHLVLCFGSFLALYLSTTQPSQSLFRKQPSELPLLLAANLSILDLFLKRRGQLLLSLPHPL